jgi:hypothetical protein
MAAADAKSGVGEGALNERVGAFGDGPIVERAIAGRPPLWWRRQALKKIWPAQRFAADFMGQSPRSRLAETAARR